MFGLGHTKLGGFTVGKRVLMNGRTTVSSVGKRKKKALDIWKRMTGTKIQRTKGSFTQSSQNNLVIGLQDLHPLRLLGKGGFGSALLVEHQQYGHRLVLKVVRKGRVSNDKLGPATKREVRPCHQLQRMQLPLDWLDSNYSPRYDFTFNNLFAC